jgi:hypothetical protein
MEKTMIVSTMRITLGLVALLLTATLRLPGAAAVEPGCPGDSQPNPDVILCEDFEQGTFLQDWEINSSLDTWPVSQFVICADGFGFKDRCAAWTNLFVFDNQWGFYGYDGWRAFAPQTEFYVRWYQYISDPYTWGTLEDKSVMLLDADHTIVGYVGSSRDELPAVPDSGPGVPFVANYQDLDWTDTGFQFTSVNRFQNQGQNIVLQPGRWYLFEWYIDVGTPGLSDGVTSLWIDDATEPITTQTLRLHYTDMRWLRSDEAGKQFSFLRLNVYDQRCDGVPYTCPPAGPAILDQSQRWDHIVISRSPIGPFVPPAPPDCSAAAAVPDVLWPPDHRMVPVAVTGVVHPNHQPVTIEITAVTADDAGDRSGDAAAGRDAIIQGSGVLLRAERAGRGDGRTYDVQFTAHDPRGARCTGTVRVAVPHSMALDAGL